MVYLYTFLNLALDGDELWGLKLKVKKKTKYKAIGDTSRDLQGDNKSCK